MKKNNKANKIIILSVIGLILAIAIVIFILNYTKDSSSLSLLEKSWISSNSNNVIDVSVYNDVPIYGSSGKGIIFSYLEEFTNSYGIEFNKVAYLNSTQSNKFKNVAFKIANFNTELTKNDILMYKDYYVIVSLKDEVINDVSNINTANFGVFEEDTANIKYYLNDNENITYIPCTDITDMLDKIKNEAVDYLVIPKTMYLDKILKNNLFIVYHMSELYKQYILTVENDNTLKSIMNKYYMIYEQTYEKERYRNYLLDTFFESKEITDVEKMNYNSSLYTYGYVINMPYESTINKEFVGILSNYLSGFEDFSQVDFKIVEYPSIEEIRKSLSRGEIDLVFGNYDTKGLNIDILKTTSPFNEEYVVLGQESQIVNSIRSLKGEKISVVSNTYLFDYLVLNGIETDSYKNTDELLRNVKNDSIVIVDFDTYQYYKDTKFKKFKIIYHGQLTDDYTFCIRDVDKNSTFYELFKFYIENTNYKSIRYNYNTNYVVNAKKELSSFAKYLIVILSTIIFTISMIIIIFNKNKRKKELKKEDKLKFTDVMTSLKNRNYLNYNISKWDENVIYPQAIVIIDLNNIKYINDNYGHEEGDEVIKKAANILIIHQQENTDIVRTDGNEFLLYMVGYDENKVIEYTRSLLKEFKELPHEFGAAIGYSMITDDIKTIDDAINEATLSMRQAKEKI